MGIGEAMEAVRLLTDRYRLLDRLGAGGMSVVWRAHDEVLGRHVAVKMLSSRFAGDAGSRDRIRAEAQAAARLSHPHITSVYDYGEAVEPDGTRVPFVVMELINGTTLESRLAQEVLPWSAAIRIAAEVAAALAAAHAQGLVHRDIKPANVMLTATGVKVVDFGIAALVGADADRTTNILGTPAYLAPERLKGKAVTPASDVYALGLLLFRMLTGRLPWQAETVTQMITAHWYTDPGPLPPIAGLPAAVADVCTRSLAKEPEDRPMADVAARTLAAAVGMRAAVPFDDTLTWSPAPVQDAETAVLSTVGSTSAIDSAKAHRPWQAAAAAALGALSGIKTSLKTGRWREHRRWLAVGAAALVTVTGLTAWATAGSQTQSTAEALPAQQQATAPPISCEVRYQTRRDQGGTFDVDLAVVNSGARPVENWTLRFDFPADQRLASGTGATWAQSGQAVTARGSAAIVPGATATAGMTGGYQASNPIPTAFTLNDAPCRATVTGAPAAIPVNNGTPANNDTAANNGGGPGAKNRWDKGSKEKKGGKHDD
ncbi:protein kinase [Planosporangium flavigriseum]|nr:serine/threonine-protein kinase [Planosporangium flavigriseum]NJC65723.1 protein kinase [Planosporangium flavigriseum]